MAVSRASESNWNPVGPRLSLGVVAGWGLTRDYSDASYPLQTIVAVPQEGGVFTYMPVSATQYVTGLRSMIAGPSLEIHWNPHLSVELDALHKPLRSRFLTILDNGVRSDELTSTAAATWQFPVLAKYRVSWGKVDTFVEAGPSFRLPQWDLSTHGLTAGVGIELQLHALKVSPAIRFTHWGPETGFGSSGISRNEASVLVGLFFGGKRLP